jgi:hypothetical protein
MEEYDIEEIKSLHEHQMKFHTLIAYHLTAQDAPPKKYLTVSIYLLVKLERYCYCLKMILAFEALKISSLGSIGISYDT